MHHFVAVAGAATSNESRFLQSMCPGNMGVGEYGCLGRLATQHGRLWHAIARCNQVRKEICTQTGEMIERIGRRVVTQRNERSAIGAGGLDRYDLGEATRHLRCSCFNALEHMKLECAKIRRVSLLLMR